MKHNEQRVLVLFDVQNMYYSAKHLYNTKVNFKEILRAAVSGRKLIRAIAYAIKTEIKEESIFHEALAKMGIEVKTKDLQVFYGGAKKGDWDIGIAMDAVRLSPKVDTVILISGDGDFKDLCNYLKSHGCRAEAIAFGETASKHLRESVDDFTDLSRDKRRFLIRGNSRHQMGSRPPMGNRPPMGSRPPMNKPDTKSPRGKALLANKEITNEAEKLAIAAEKSMLSARKQEVSAGNEGAKAPVVNNTSVAKPAPVSKPVATKPAVPVKKPIAKKAPVKKTVAKKTTKK